MKATVSTKGPLFEGKAPEIIEAGILAFMYEATQFLELKVKEGTPQGVGGMQGGLRSTIHGEVTGKGTPVIKGIVAHQSLYGDVVEKGRTAGKAMPPEGTLLQWMEKKLGMSEKEAKKLEFVVRRKIGKKGFPGALMFETAWQKFYPQIEAMAQARGLTITRELNG